MNDIDNDGVYLLIQAMAHDAAEEYREYMKVLKNKTLNRDEKEYYKLRAEETLKFFSTNLFRTAFPNVGEYIIEQLRKEN